MLEIKKQVVELSPEEVMELEQIITDKDLKGGFQLVKKNLWKNLRFPAKQP